MNKRSALLSGFILLLLSAVLLTCACGNGLGKGSAGSVSDGSAEDMDPAGDRDAIRIVTTLFPVYDWVCAIIGEPAQAAGSAGTAQDSAPAGTAGDAQSSEPAGAAGTAQAAELPEVLLLNTGTDLHSYQPSVQDMVQISACDLFICTGGESEQWVEDVLAETDNPHLRVIRLLSLLDEDDLLWLDAEHPAGADRKQSARPAGGHGAETSGNEANGHEALASADEHVWLSLRRAQYFCQAIADSLVAIDPQHAARYQANASAYSKRLQALDRKGKKIAASAGKSGQAGNNALLFCDRFPFRYLLADYGLDYYAAFDGCSAESEASFATVAFLADKADTLNVSALLALTESQQEIARTVAANTKKRDLPILTMNSMQSVQSAQSLPAQNGRPAAGQAATAQRRAELPGGAAYLSIMEQNLDTLAKALN